MNENQNTSWIVAGAGALIIIIGGWWVVMHNQPASSDSMTSTSTAASTDTSSSATQVGNIPTVTTEPAAMPSTTSSGEALAAQDQPAGMSVAIDSVTLSKPGWVAVRDVRGWTLGAAWFDAGTHTNVSVPLLRASEAGTSYQALLFIDTAGDHTYDVHGETLVMNSDGSVVGAKFMAK